MNASATTEPDAVETARTLPLAAVQAPPRLIGDPLAGFAEDLAELTYQNPDVHLVCIRNCIFSATRNRPTGAIRCCWTRPSRSTGRWCANWPSWPAT